MAESAWALWRPVRKLCIPNCWLRLTAVKFNFGSAYLKRYGNVYAPNSAQLLAGRRPAEAGPTHEFPARHRGTFIEVVIGIISRTEKPRFHPAAVRLDRVNWASGHETGEDRAISARRALGFPMVCRVGRRL